MTRNEFLKQSGISGASLLVLNGCDFLRPSSENASKTSIGITIKHPRIGEDVFAYINRIYGSFNRVLYQQILGAANAFKEGDLSLNIAASDEKSREFARRLLEQTKIQDLHTHAVYEDELFELIQESLLPNEGLFSWTLGNLKAFMLTQTEEKIKGVISALSSDIIACLVKILSNEELILIGQKVFNPLPGSQIGSKGYMGARVQPNSPTDHPDDIRWQVFDAWSYAVGDVVLGTNPVSSEPQSVARIESTLQDIINTFDLENVIPNCVLAHVDIQAEVERMQPGTTGIWFQSIAGTVAANKTFDVTIEKMLNYATMRNGHFGFYAETGQGADFTNGHAEGFDMVIHESRKYGFLRVLKQRIAQHKGDQQAWVHVNDVAGFIGPEVFRTREQLVRCCLEDTVMGKLHGLTIGLDICSTLHMDVNLQDLDWCIEQVMPVNPAYLMALPTKNDPMLSYLTTAFNDHVRIRNQFGYKVNDAMWEFFKKIQVIDADGKPTEHFGDPQWVYYQYCMHQGDTRSIEQIYEASALTLQQIANRGVPIAQGFGLNYWDLPLALEKQVSHLYEDAKISLWSEFNLDFVSKIAAGIPLFTQALDRKDYVYHPPTGEVLSAESKKRLKELRSKWNGTFPEVQIVISDGLNARAIMDDNHLFPFLSTLTQQLVTSGIRFSANPLVLTNGRVRAGYACGELLFGQDSQHSSLHGIIHIIGERPGSGHHNFSAYVTVASAEVWRDSGTVDHDITRVISGISDTALNPEVAAMDTLRIIKELFLTASSKYPTV
ncbi:MAG: hypothetical protein RLZZ241_1822 [Bacteroidota bacterium]|jgi:ethanolamine ammonia-lyase large subunit